MKKKLLLKAGLLLSAVVLAGCNGGSKLGENEFRVPTEGHPFSDYFPGEVAKKTYNAFLATAITEPLNYLTSQAGNLAAHWANFVDGLLLQNEFGSLNKQLAVSAAQENDYKNFTFGVKTGVKWVKWDGTQYNATINGQSVPQYVSATDFLTSAKTVLSYQNHSETYYLLTNFIEGAMEYYQYTYLNYMSITGGAEWTQYNNPTNFARKLNELIEDATGEPSSVTVSDLDAIANFSRVGVKVVEEPTTVGGGKIQYTLKNSAFYFPTLLTYSCYLPVNSYFLDEIRASNLGNGKENLLYCGPFTLAASDTYSVVYTKNQSYHEADNVFVDRINYTILGQDEDIDIARTRYEEGYVDGFSLSEKDIEGWKKYVTGPDGTGTIENPYDPSVNSRDYDYIDYVYGLHLNINRVSNSTNGRTASTSYAKSKGGSLDAIKNAEKALRLDAVRELLIQAFDLYTYSEVYSATEELRGQYTMNTYVPRGFVSDQFGKDYTTTHYYEVYAEHKGITVEEAATILEQGQFENIMLPDEDPELTTLRNNALKAIEVFNTTVAADDSEKITLPIQFEYYSIWQDETTRMYDTNTINKYNQRLNGMYDTVDFTTSTPGVSFVVIPTADVTSSSYEQVSNGGNFDISSTWGWGPDYGDPMSYMNTFKKHGDWSSIFGYVNEDVGTNGDDNVSYKLNGNSLSSYDLLDEYTALVNNANSEYENISERYNLFAEAEYMLLNELHIFRPLTMTGQGRGLSISRAAGYLSPSGSYGLAKDRLDGLLVLKETISGDTRKKCTTTYEAKKAAYLDEYGSMYIYD